MISKNFSVRLLLLFISIVGCSSGNLLHSHGYSRGGDDSNNHLAASSESHVLALNDSKKWQMDESTRSIFARMALRVDGQNLESVDGDDLKNHSIIIDTVELC